MPSVEHANYSIDIHAIFIFKTIFGFGNLINSFTRYIKKILTQNNIHNLATKINQQICLCR